MLAFELNTSAMGEQMIAPEDEMRGVSEIVSSIESQQQRQQQQQQSLFRHALNHRKPFSDNNNTRKDSSRATTMDDENRIPPPLDDVKAITAACDITNATSNHPDFQAWKKEMKDMLLAGTVTTSPSKSKMNVVNLTDQKATRFHKSLEKQLRSVKSDCSTATAPESDEHSSSGASSKSVPLPAGRTGNRGQKKQKSKGSKIPTKPFDTVYVVKETTAKVRKQPKSTVSDQRALSPTISMSPPTSGRPTISAEDAPDSPKPTFNSTELNSIMVGLQELKNWAEGSPKKQQQPVSRLPKSSPPRSSPSKMKGIDQNDALPPPLPRSIVVPQFCMTGDNKNKHFMIENRSVKDQGIPSEVLTIHTASTTRKKRRKKKKKRVRFRKPLITETQYRPRTAKEDIDSLYFQEEELLVWEKDEMTTLRDRFEIALSEFNTSNDEYDEETEQTDSLLSFATPVISFHDSYSFSFSDGSDNESFD